MAENDPELVIRVFLKSKLILLIHANPSTRSGQVYANLETIRED
jgi:hypothetical protein